MSAPTIFLGMPGYGELTAGASRGFWRATRLPDERVYRQYNQGSLLACNFNVLWAGALNLARQGLAPAYFAMQHADVEPEDWWLDTLIAELEAEDLDILGVAAPIKDHKGLTSVALDRPDGDTWRPLCRLTLSEVHRLPPTFTSEDVGHPLLLNTGLWACRFDESWARKVRFTINDRIVVGPDGRYVAQCEPEDWYFSRLLHEMGKRIGCTRKIRLDHRGPASFTNAVAWGQPYDAAYTPKSPLPESDRDGFRFPYDVDGWLTYDEGKALWNLARGKRVLEVGSYCGRSTICLAQSAYDVIAVDPHDGGGTPAPQDTFERFHRNLDRYGVASKINDYMGTFAAAVADGSLADFAPFDLAFIDAAHDRESVESDIAHALPLLAPGGLVAFHDYQNPEHPGVSLAVDDLLSRGATLETTVDSLAVVRPPAVSAPLEPATLEV